MDHEHIMILMDMFLKPDYSVKKAIDLLGEVEDDSLEGWLILKPRAKGIEHIKLEYLESKEAPEDKFLASIFIRYEKPVPISFSKLTRKYGSPKELARLKPEGDIPYRFDIKGRPIPGELVLFVDGRTEKDLRPVRGIKFIRYPLSQPE